MSLPEIHLEFTQDPNALKYVLDNMVLLERGTAVFQDKTQAEASPLAKRILAIPGIATCTVGRDFLLVTKTQEGDWEQVDGLTRSAITSFAASGEVAVNPIALDNTLFKEQKKHLNSTEAQTIQKVLDEEINPAVASHGGHVDLVDIQGARVYVRLSGGCQGCGMSKVTLQQGVETAIKRAVASIQEVVDVTDHAGGTNPYYQ